MTFSPAAHAEDARVCCNVCQAVKSLAGNDDAKKQVQAHAVFGSVIHTLLRYRYPLLQHSNH
jgi:hypothetical protein